MINSRTLLLPAIMLFSLLISDMALAAKKSRVKSSEASLSIVRNGQTIEVNEDDAKIISSLLTDAFNDYTIDTSQIWYRQSIEKDGKTVEEKWNNYKRQSYFSLVFTEKEVPPKKEGDTNDDGKKKFVVKRGPKVLEMLLTISEVKGKSLLGNILAKLENGETRAYQTDGKNLLMLFCLDTTQKYLPDHYHILFERYSDPQYGDAELGCSSEKFDDETDNKKIYIEN